MQRDTDTAPLSAEGIAARRASALRLLADGVAMTEGESIGVLNARACADALDALSARVAELEHQLDLSEKQRSELLHSINFRKACNRDANAAEARATQAEAERDAAQADALMDIAHALGCELDRAATLQAVVALKAALSASQAREAGMRGAIDIFVAAYRERYKRPSTSGIKANSPMLLEVGKLREASLAALSPAKPAQDPCRNMFGPAIGDAVRRHLESADPLVTAYDNGVDHAWGVAKPLALAAEGVINWCDIALAHADRFDAHGVRNLTGPAFDVLRETVEAARASGLLTTETEGSSP